MEAESNQPMKLRFGNKCYVEKTPRGEFVNKKFEQNYRWCMYLTLDDDQSTSTNYVERVIYTLSDSYAQTEI